MTDPRSDSPGFLLWQVTLAWQRDITAALKPHALTHVQFVLLANTWWLNEAGERPTQAVLAERAGTDIKMTSQVVRALEGKDLLRRDRDELDTRARRLSVTPAGARLARQAIVTVEAVDRALLDMLAPSRRQSFVQTLRMLARGTGHR